MSCFPRTHDTNMYISKKPVTYLSSGGKVGEKISGTAVCDKSKFLFLPLRPSDFLT